MCQQCQEAVMRHYPHLPESEMMKLLWEATCFPFCGPETLEEQLIELKANTDGSLGQAVAFAHKQMDEALERHNQEIQAESLT